MIKKSAPSKIKSLLLSKGLLPPPVKAAITAPAGVLEPPAAAVAAFIPAALTAEYIIYAVKTADNPVKAVTTYAAIVIL